MATQPWPSKWVLFVICLGALTAGTWGLALLLRGLPAERRDTAPVSSEARVSREAPVSTDARTQGSDRDDLDDLIDRAIRGRQGGGGAKTGRVGPVR